MFFKKWGLIKYYNTNTLKKITTSIFSNRLLSNSDNWRNSVPETTHYFRNSKLLVQLCVDSEILLQKYEVQNIIEIQ